MAYTTLLLCIGGSCQKEPCPCLDCGAPGQKMTYRKTIENARADLDLTGDALVIEGVEGAPLICDQQLYQFEGKLNATYIQGKPQPFKYRVWGKIYNCDNCPTYIKGDALEILITKIEYQN